MGSSAGIKELESRPKWNDKDSPKIDAPRQILELLGKPQDLTPSIHVAGTNGKGTISTLLSAMLLSQGKRVAQIASPFLGDLTEQLIICGRPVDRKRFNSALEKVFEVEKSEPYRLTFFEAGVVASYLLISEEKLDWQVVEAGLGGRTDATNVLKAPRVTIIASISLDHTHILGETETLIAREKSGIFKNEVPAIVGKVSNEAERAISEEAKKTSTPVMSFNTDFFIEGDSVKSKEGWLLPLPVKEKKLYAKYQKENYALAAFVGHLLKFNDESISNGMLRAKWPGRTEEIEISKERVRQTVLFDGAHNPAGMSGLMEYISKIESQNLHFIIAILGTKDFSEMLRIILESCSNKKLTFSFCPLERLRSISPDKLRESAGQGSVFKSASEALASAIKGSDEDTQIIVTGSLYLVGELRKKMANLPFNTYEC